MNQSTLKYTLAHFHFNLFLNLYTVMMDRSFMAAVFPSPVFKFFMFKQHLLT